MVFSPLPASTSFSRRVSASSVRFAPERRSAPSFSTLSCNLLCVQHSDDPRGTTQGDYVKKLFEGKPFEYIIVEDVGEAGAFDKAVQDVEGVLHTASPFHFKATDPEELVRPAVDGTTNILKSVGAHGKNVKRVVV